MPILSSKKLGQSPSKSVHLFHNRNEYIYLVLLDKTLMASFYIIFFYFYQYHT
jgi:hypothetical protein